MTKLESYMIEGNFFAHPNSTPMSKATRRTGNSCSPFEELSFFSKEMKILGVYPAHPFRGLVRGDGGVISSYNVPADQFIKIEQSDSYHSPPPPRACRKR